MRHSDTSLERTLELFAMQASVYGMPMITSACGRIEDARSAELIGQLLPGLLTIAIAQNRFGKPIELEWRERDGLLEAMLRFSPLSAELCERAFADLRRSLQDELRGSLSSVEAEEGGLELHVCLPLLLAPRQLRGAALRALRRAGILALLMLSAWLASMRGVGPTLEELDEPARWAASAGMSPATFLTKN